MIIILSILFTVAIVIGLTIANQFGMVLYPIREALTDDKGDAKKLIYEPLFLCWWCMPSVYSSIGYLFAFLYQDDVNLRALFFYPVVVSASSFIVAVLWGLHQLIYKKIEQVQKEIDS